MPRVSEGGGKKKFGKNLNKLVKPAAPPIAQPAAGQQRNGLLLLSAQKKSTGGLLSNKPKPVATTTSSASSTKHYESSTVSTHDVLLSAVTGKSERDANQTPDAWGVAAAEKQQPEESPPESPTEVKEDRNLDVAPESSSPTPVGPSWDEYGGRGEDSQPEQGRDQVMYMARLAKERSSKARSEEEERVRTQKERAAERLRELEEKRQPQHAEPRPLQSWDRTRSGTRTLWEPNQTKEKRDSEQEPEMRTIPASKTTNVSTVHEQQPTAYEGPVIHLSSYEDRDRGERQNGAAPRMLYDPKSGSMVAVQVREERKKLRRKPRGITRRERSTRQSDTAELAGDGPQKGAEAKKEDSKSSEKMALLKKEKGSRTRLPRTCGVLYERDGKGQFRSSDGCDGDLGYGAHSVPGGRALNPEAYREYLKLQEELAQNEDSADDYMRGYGVYNGGDVVLHTGFNLSEPEDEPLQPEPLEFVKAGDKLELVTGVDDSPTLKPTAKEFAPSQAAIAAAAAAQNRGAILETSYETEDGGDSDVADEGNSEEDENESCGLGFDPAQNMDGLMQSPPNDVDESARLVASVDLDALRLDPPMFSTAPKEEPSPAPDHIFAFGSSGTWGAKTGALSSTTDDWGVPGATSGGLFGGVDTAAFGSGSSKSAGPAKSFLGMPTTSSTWGSHHGLGGLSLGGESKAATSGD